ncbi:TPM domain-containing protein [Streptomyces albireticuli]|uniref:TPM domain-containing protein n=1 Tax=Streptomyces albireticuli TaxID=1940 RepID=UPI001E3689B3|nr:TPM domain-containing protein [Streptomyces albireticuli]MCD9142619.1 TPM domain-containing protein [Streptomyces albireticuli]MCD9164018.1 TPM domain-containing protein [Streptomyces albireticuli]MCD9192747.1 TPM domain-containing protein [Streptomyces albireticuli]
MTRLSRRYRPPAPGGARVRALLALLTLCALLLPGPPARADTPLDLDTGGRITDTVGALGRRRAQVISALDKLHSTHRIQLYVTYVRDFSGRSGHDWADATADRNGLGPRDVLLAVATHRQQYAVSAAGDSGFRRAQLDAVAATAIAPAVSQHDWAGAAIGAADGYGSVLRGEPVRPPAISPGDSDPGGGLVPRHRAVWLPVAVAAAVCLTVLCLCSRRAARRRADRRARRAAARAARTGRVDRIDGINGTVRIDRTAVGTSTEPGLTRMVQPLTPLPALEAEAARALVGTDDAVRTSAEELLFATAQLGGAATRPFAEAVGYAKGELADAFRLRQRLDDAPYEDPELRRRVLDEICSHCTSANRRLDAESEAFDRLRGLRANAAGVLAHAEAAARALAPRVDTAEAALTALTGCCAGTALSAFARHPAEARDRLAFATAGLAEARRTLEAGDADGAVVSLRAAEAALSQARTLTTAALRRAHELTGTAARLRAAVLDAEAGLAAARSGPTSAEGARRAATAGRVLTEVRRDMAGGRYDPRAVLRRVEEAAASLDAEAVRAGGSRADERRARRRVERAVLAARGEVAAARDFVSTHRGAVGCRARTRLAEAERHLARARRLPADEGKEILSATGHADSLARQARALAEHDVTDYLTGTGTGRPAAYDPEAPRPARALGGALLGGVIMAGLLPATFGGGATRGRLAGGTET